MNERKESQYTIQRTSMYEVTKFIQAIPVYFTHRFILQRKTMKWWLKCSIVVIVPSAQLSKRDCKLALSF